MIILLTISISSTYFGQ